MIVAVDAEDSKGRVQIQPLQARTPKAPSCPSWGFTLVLLYLTAFWNYRNVASHLGNGRERSATENMCPWDTCVCEVPLEDTYSVAALQGCSLSPAEGPPDLDTAVWQTHRVSEGDTAGGAEQARQEMQTLCQVAGGRWGGAVGNWCSSCTRCTSWPLSVQGWAKHRQNHHFEKRQEWEWGQIHNISRHIISTYARQLCTFMQHDS